MMDKVWSSIEEVPYCFWRSSVKFQGHTGWKIDDLNLIWVRLQAGRSYQIPQICLVIVYLNHILECDILWIYFFYLTVSESDIIKLFNHHQSCKADVNIHFLPVYEIIWGNVTILCVHMWQVFYFKDSKVSLIWSNVQLGRYLARSA